jgi:hypothetical protein
VLKSVPETMGQTWRYLQRRGKPLSPPQTVKEQTAALFLEGAAMMYLPKVSDLAKGPQAHLRPCPHDDVVMQRQAEILAALLDLLGHPEIGL